MATPLSIIFEMSWQSSVVPSDWKGEIITPSFIKGNMTQGTTGQSHLSAWQSHITDLPGNYVKAHGRIRRRYPCL